ncbi:hypothetical protein Pfo_019973 [Paulownia fortunei]|nr:hypothetical protein Pfo_019973 [Paulownia fortunei]
MTVKVCGLRAHIPRILGLRGRRPCMLSSSYTLPRYEFFFPNNRHSNSVNADLRNYTIAGQSLPQNGMWLLLVAQLHRKVILYNGQQVIPLPDLPEELNGHVMGSFVGQPNRGFEVLIVEILDNLVLTFHYNPALNGWTHGRIYNCHYIQRPMAHVTTSTRFQWVDTERGVLFYFRNYWGNPRPRLYKFVLGPSIQHAEMVSSIVYEDYLESFVVFRDGIFKLYFWDTCTLTHLPLLRGENIYAAAYSSGFRTSAQNDVCPSRESSRILYLSSWVGDCVTINLDRLRGQQRGDVIKRCHCPGLLQMCNCRSFVFLLDEHSLDENFTDEFDLSLEQEEEDTPNEQ